MPKINQYAAFCMEKRKQYEERKGTKLSMEDLIILCAPDWEALSTAERAVYKQKAKTLPRIAGKKGKTIKTIGASDVQEDPNDSDSKEFFKDDYAMQKKKEKDEFRLTAKEFVLIEISLDNRLSSLKTHELFVVAITPRYVNEHRINPNLIEAAPAEIAVMSFTLDDGVKNTFWSQIEIKDLINDPDSWKKSQERESQHGHGKEPMSPDMTLPNINILATKLTELANSKFLLFDENSVNELFACLKYLREQQENEKGFFSDCFKNEWYRMISAAAQIFHFEATGRKNGHEWENEISSRKKATEVFSRKELMKSIKGEDIFNYYCDFHRLKEPEDAYDGCALAQVRILLRQLFRFTAPEYDFDPNDRDHDVCPQKFYFDEEKAKPSLSEQTFTTGPTLKSDSDFNECLNDVVVASEQDDNRLETENTTERSRILQDGRRQGTGPDSQNGSVRARGVPCQQSSFRQDRGQGAQQSVQLRSDDITRTVTPGPQKARQTPVTSVENFQKPAIRNDRSGARPKVAASYAERERFSRETLDSRSTENRKPEYKDANGKQYMTLAEEGNKVFDMKKKEPITETDKRGQYKDSNVEQCSPLILPAIDNEVLDKQEAGGQPQDDISAFIKKGDFLPGLGRGRKI